MYKRLMAFLISAFLFSSSLVCNALTDAELKAALGLPDTSANFGSYCHDITSIAPSIGQFKPKEGTQLVKISGGPGCIINFSTYEIKSLDFDYMVFQRVPNIPYINNYLINNSRYCYEDYLLPNNGFVESEVKIELDHFGAGETIFYSLCNRYTPYKLCSLVSIYDFCYGWANDNHGDYLVFASPQNAGGTGYEAPLDGTQPGDVVTKDKVTYYGVTSGLKSVHISFTRPDIESGSIDFGDPVNANKISSIYIGNFKINSFLDIIDPNPELLTSEANILDDISAITTSQKVVDGIATDGVTRVILRSRVDFDGPVKFCLANSSTAPTDGSLLPLSNIYIEGGQCITVLPQQTTDGLMAFAVYLSPTEGNRFTSSSIIDHKVTFEITQEGMEPIVHSLNLVRPPVVLIHGLWSNLDTWTFPLVSDPRFEITRANYQSTNADAFSNNAGVPWLYITKALNAMRHRKIAVTQANVVGHSMGGILARNHVSRSDYRNNLNFMTGDIHKLITLDTPHQGSEWAVFITTFFYDLVYELTDKLGYNCNSNTGKNCAVRDLSDLALGRTRIGKTPVPSHAIVGVGGDDDAVKAMAGKFGNIWTVFQFFSGSSIFDVFGSQLNDTIVSQPSQMGGLLSRDNKSIYGGLDGVHAGTNPSNTSSSVYSERIAELLELDIQDPAFAEFPETSGQNAVSASVRSKLEREVVENGLTITSPMNDSQVISGQTVSVAVQPNSSITVDNVLLLGLDAEIDNTAPFEFQVTIPSEAAGNIELIAVGKDAANNTFFTSAPITLRAIPAASLQSIEVRPPEDLIFPKIGATYDLMVIGHYSDGVERDLTASSTGTRYASSDPNQASVSPEGVVTAQGEGSALIIIKNQDASLFLTTVMNRNSYALGVTKIGDGTITSDPAGIDCGEICGATFKEGSVAVLTAVPTAGYTFAGWNGACVDSVVSCEVNMDGPKAVSATFIADGGNWPAGAHLESPQQGSFESGIGLIRGWVCQADAVEVQIDGGARRQVAYGTTRGDTIEVCGDANNGFGYTFNWNALGDGNHNLRAFADGVEFANVNFTVTTLGEEYLRGASGEAVLPNFPQAGSNVTLRWAESHQNFVIVGADQSQTSAQPSAVDSRAQFSANLESPQQGSFESGIGLIRGWVCQADAVEVQIDGGARRQVAYGTTRGDTIEVCGDANNGFGYTFNWNALGDGNHNLRAFADGVEFANVNFTVTTLGEEYLRGASGEAVLPNFPQAGSNVTLRWAESHQNFVIVSFTR
ncbi:MAG: hypothetical protein H6969_11730 [Gammaproteobacteria bacterium]|nr:hypothetical protein [Gammaproteobacteria bacterium]